MTECGRAYRGGVRVGRGTTLGLPEDWVYSSKHGFVAVRQRLAAPAENDLPGVAIADSRLDPSGRVALDGAGEEGARGAVG